MNSPKPTGNMYLSALVELGLVLFALTMVINGLAQLLIIAHDEERLGQSMTSPKRPQERSQQRHVELCAACARFSPYRLCFVILAYLLYNGGKSVNLNFFTKLPLPPGQEGGGMANAIVGSAEIVVLATLIGLPIGFFAGIYLAEFGGKTFPFHRALHSGSVERHPLDRDRHLRLDGHRGPDASLLRPRRRDGTEPDADPDHRPQHRTVPAGSAARDARRRAGAGREQMAHDRHA